MATERVLYWGSGSPPCWRVMALLTEKQLDYQSKQISFSESKDFDKELIQKVKLISIAGFRRKT